VKEAGSLKQDDVIKALDHARIAEGPGGPAEMVPGQHDVRMNMYLAQAHDGNFRIVKRLGVIDPKECVQGLDKPIQKIWPHRGLRAVRSHAPQLNVTPEGPAAHGRGQAAF
jgi:hypothetical protein